MYAAAPPELPFDATERRDGGACVGFCVEWVEPMDSFDCCRCAWVVLTRGARVGFASIPFKRSRQSGVHADSLTKHRKSRYFFCDDRMSVSCARL